MSALRQAECRSMGSVNLEGETVNFRGTTKTIIAEVWRPTARKTKALEEIQAAWQAMAQPTYKERRAVAPRLHSAYARNRFKSRKAHDPVYISVNDGLRVERSEKKLARMWVQIPHRPRAPLWLPLRMSPHGEEALTSCRLRDSRLVWCGDRFFMHFKVTREVTPVRPRAILAVDLGERRLAVTVLRDQNGFRDPRFYGTEARGIRRHYAWLRRRLGERKLLRTIRKVKDTEKRKVNSLCHRISRAIVDQAKANDAAIVIGDLKGIGLRPRGKRLNRIVHAMPHRKLSAQIEYKAKWEGLPVYRISERDTSRTCHRCKSIRTRRVVQGLFECLSCGLAYNADLNGAKNIAERFWCHARQDGAPGSEPVTLPERILSVDEEKGS